MSHEIRTPMNAIMGYAELIDSGEMDEQTRVESVQAMRRAGRHLLTIINDVLDISKIESGHMRVFEEPCGLRPLFDDVLGGLRNQAAHGRNTLRAEVSGTVPDTVLTDPHRVRQILINLVGNALKFTSRGSVTMRVSHADGWLRVDVEDTGVGISADKLESIFRPFEQGDASSTRRHEGTGLGLAISRRLADLLGGELTARSTPGVGSVFTLRIPAPAAEDAAPVSELTERASPVGSAPALALRGRVLLVEDGQDNQKLISFILRRAGLTVELAANGAEAVRTIERDAAFDLIITDMQMPEMDGYEATRRLRAMGFDLPILALTANAMAGDRARCLDAGCDDYEAKPIDRASLLATVQRMLEESARRSRRGAA
jgi:CheY-like chemotaxis protein/anti-sigma regulatory factor (Ser/Thr protein kinase)